MITFLPDVKANKMAVNDFFTVKGRGEIKVGRFARAILGDKAILKDLLDENDDDQLSVDTKFTDKEFEEFVNLYKSTFAHKGSGFELVSGDDISDCYDEENYEICTGTLGGSCMRHEECQPYFKIYTKNPESCKLLVLRGNDGGILGRAIVWKLSKSPVDGVDMFMDRIYTARDSDINKFIKYAEDNNWLIKYKMNSHDIDAIIFRHNGKDIVGIAESKLSKVEFDEYPFMDTMSFVDKKTKTCSNINGKEKIECTDTDGEGNTCHECDGDGTVDGDCSTCNGNGNEECPDCSGSGEIKCMRCNGEGSTGNKVECIDCGGSGRVKKLVRMGRCNTCNGTGEIPEICPDCGGSGEITCTKCEGEGEFECKVCDGSGSVDDMDCNNCVGFYKNKLESIVNNAYPTDIRSQAKTILSKLKEEPIKKKKKK